MDIIFTDFSSEFNKVSHRLLCNVKLESYGIVGKLSRWIADFLKGRKQRVVLGYGVSDWVDVYSRVPQGSVLGPLLFNLFINDLAKLLRNNPKLFADDTKLIGIIVDNLSVLSIQRDLEIIANWCHTWLMELNESKCKVLHIGKKNPKATKSVLGCNGMSYEKRLEKIGITSLEERRLRGDMIQQFKFFKGLNTINWYSNQLVSTHNHETRQHNVYSRETCHSNSRHNFFTNRIVNQWNRLSIDCRESTSVNKFKNTYDFYKLTLKN